jgi:AraC-like DNA-binding protein
MTEHPASLTMRPDLLSDALRAIRLTGALYYRVSTTTPWPAIRAPLGVELTSAFARRTRNVASYHVVIEGSCWAAAEECDPVQLGEGDIVAFPTGAPYFLACELPPGNPPPEAGSLVDLLRGVASGAVPPSFTFGAGSERTTLVCAFLGCDPLPFDPLFASLPAMLVVREMKGQLATLVELALTEVDSAGSMSVRERLSESMFLETLRQHLVNGAAAAWTRGTDDRLAAHALALLHHDPGYPWTLASLAAEVGVSRSALAERFPKAIGQPPMQYLARRRLELAASLLNDGATVAAVARRVGYGSEAAFSRAFKRSTGITPSAWRGDDRAP